MKSIASLEADDAVELLKRLKKEAIPFEVQTVTQEGGLDYRNIMVADSYYERACNVAEKWNAELKGRPPKSPKSSRPKWMRFGFRTLSVLLFCAAIWIFVRSADDAAAGDVEMVQNYRGISHISNRYLHITIGLLVGGFVCFGLSMPDKENNDKNDNTSA